MVHLHVDNANPELDAAVHILERVQVTGRTVRQLQNEMVHVQRIQKIHQRPPLTFLNCLTAVVAKAKMHSALNLDLVQNAVDRFGSERRVLRIASHVGLIHLDAGARQVGDLCGQNIGDGERQRFKVPVVVVEQGPGKHVRAGYRELEWAARHGCGGVTVGQEIQASLANRRLHGTSRPAAEIHRSQRGKCIPIRLAQPRFDSGHRSHKVIDHAIGVGMIDVEAIELAIGRQIDPGLPLNVENDARCVAPRLVARQRNQPIGQGIRADSGGEDSRGRRNCRCAISALVPPESFDCQRVGGASPRERKFPLSQRAAHATAVALAIVYR